MLKSKQIIFTGYKNCRNSKFSLLATVPGGHHIKPLSGDLFEYIVDLVLFNDFDIQKMKVDQKRFLQD